MTQFYVSDEGGGERVLCVELAEALQIADEWLADYRKEAHLDFEWSTDVTRITVGLPGVSEDEDDDIVLYRATAFGTDEEGYEYRIEKVGPFVEGDQGLAA